jgi:hypothetical protein
MAEANAGGADGGGESPEKPVEPPREKPRPTQPGKEIRDLPPTDFIER